MHARPSTHRDAGFTLVEALLGLLLVTALVVGVSDLLVVAIGVVREARQDTSASFAAARRLESLIAAIDSGVPVALSPDDALDTAAAGFNDVVDAAGRVVGTPGADQAGVFRRRWRVRPLPSDPARALVIQVRVLTFRRAAEAVAVQAGASRSGDLLVTTVRRAP
jgi:type II secretory pathway pseudopilin PulG